MNIKKLSTNQPIVLTGIALSLILFAVISRLAPHPANVAPIAAIALLGGVILPRRWALSLPLVAMVISDLFLGLHSLIVFTWGSFLLVAVLASYGLKKVSVSSVALYSFAGSALFFIITNFGVWLEGRLYDRTVAGLIQCYYNALPFFRNTLIGDLLYAGILFAGYVLVVKYREAMVNTHEGVV